jgi:sec-independent protein translocase protein TatA
MTELIIVFIIIMVLFGARRLPELGKGIGQAIRNFKTGVADTETEVKKAVEDREDKKEKPS